MNKPLVNLVCLAVLGTVLSVSAAPPQVAEQGLTNAEQKSGGRFSLANLPALNKAIDVKNSNENALLSAPGVHGAGVGWGRDGKPKIKVLLDISASAAGIPAAIDGTEVEIIRTGPIFALNVDCTARGLSDCPPDHADAASGELPPGTVYRHERPVPIGISAGHTGVTAGTIGCRVSSGCHKYALSNAHVFANENAGQPGDDIVQPGPIDGGISPDDSIGTLYDSVPIIMSISPSTKNYVDAAIISTTASLVGDATRPAGYGVPRADTVAASPDMRVKKFGRTTWSTSADIAMVSASLNVGYTTGNARFVDQIVIESDDPAVPFSQFGDSGALIVADGGSNDRKPVGLLFASTSDGVYTIANPIDTVLDAFDVTIDGD